MGHVDPPDLANTARQSRLGDDRALPAGDLDAGLCLPAPDLAFQARKNRGNSRGSTTVNTVAGCNDSYVPPAFGARERNWQWSSTSKVAAKATTHRKRVIPNGPCRLANRQR